MKLKKIALKNIRSYQNQEIEFPDGSLLLSGDIGSGKTTVLLAIEYALFGLQPGQRGSALLRNDAFLGEVSLEFEVSGKEVIIERKLKRGSKNISNEYAAITIDGNKEESSVTELKTKVLNLLGYPKEFIKKNNLLYRYTVYTPQEQMKQIVLEDSETRLNILRHIFGIDKYKRIRENLTILLNVLKEDSKLLQGEIKSLDQDRINLGAKKALITHLSEKIKEKQLELSDKIQKRKLIEQESRDLEEKIREKSKFESEVEKTNILITTKKERLSSLSIEEEEILKSLSEIKEFFDEDILNRLIGQISSRTNKIENLNSYYIHLISQINSLVQNRKNSLSKKERIFKIDICPTCLQDVSNTHKHNIMNETESELVKGGKKLDSLDKERTAIIDLLEKEKSQKTRLEEQKLDLEILKTKTGYAEKSKQKIESIRKSKENLEKDLLLLEKHIDNLKSDILNFSKFNNFYKLKQDELRTAFLEERHTEISLAELKKELELTLKEVSNLESLISEKEKSKSKLSEIQEISDWLSSKFSSLVNFTERNVLMKLRVEFSKLFSKWFKMLVSEDSLEVHLDENFTPLVLQGETEMDYTFLSGGERTAVALAYRLALNQTINSIIGQIKTRNIVILDEPTDGFSEAQLDKMRDILEELNVKQLIVVSHEQKIESFVDNVIKLRKEGDSSLVDEISHSVSRSYVERLDI